MSGTAEGACRVVVIGAGASGALTATHLVTTLSNRYRVTLVDPAVTTGRGVAYATHDDRHLLNVPVAGMSALPRDPDHFLRWVRREHDPRATGTDFVPRRVFGDYVEQLLESAAQYPGNARLERVHESVVDIAHDGHEFTVVTESTSIGARAVVLATGAQSRASWAPADLLSRVGEGFVLDPWSEQLPDGDLLLVGTGLTAVDIALAADRPGRTLHTLSRNDLFPRGHRTPATPSLPPPPGITRVSGVEELRQAVADHVRRVQELTGDWRAAVDGLRPVTAQLWAALGPEDKETFLRDHARVWEVHRHRMAPATAARLRDLAQSGRLVRHRGSVLAARASTRGGLDVTFGDGTMLQVVHVAAVVNCAGPDSGAEADPLLRRLICSEIVRPGTADLGIATASDGRVVGHLASAVPFFAVGAPRRGELWETTAMPEIREQAYAVAQSVARTLCGERHSSPTDTYGLRLTTDAAAAAAYNDGLGRLLRLQEGAEDGLRNAVELDPGFVQAQAALALLEHERADRGSAGASLAAAHEHAARRHLADREISFLDAVTARLHQDETTGGAELLRHVRRFPRDALAVSVAVPTVAFGGLTSGRQTADLVESLGRAYGDDWWYAGQLAFVRQDQGRWQEAEELAAYALSVEPASGHAVHSRAHVFYETGQHGAGLAWLDGWIRTSGQLASHRSHFSWHAALYELVLGDVDAVRRRYASQLAPPIVSGFRALVDGGSLLWRCRMAQAPLETLDAPSILSSAPAGWLISPPTAFAALHVALSLAAAADPVGLAALRATSLAHRDPVFRDVVAPVCRALQAVIDRDPARAVRELDEVLPRAAALGGSDAQRDVLEETLVYSLALSGQGERAAALLDGRLARRCSPLDVRRRDWLRRGHAGGGVGADDSQALTRPRTAT